MVEPSKYLTHSFGYGRATNSAREGIPELIFRITSRNYAGSRVVN